MAKEDPVAVLSLEWIYDPESEIEPSVMCPGPDNTILAINQEIRGKEVLMYDVTSREFTLKDRILLDVNDAENIHYMETARHGGIVIVSTYYSISAHSTGSGALVWKIKNTKIDGKVLKPHGMCSNPNKGTLYVSDWNKKRLIAIDSNTGEVIQCIQLPVMGQIYNIAWCHVQNHIAILHQVNHSYRDGFQVTYYSTECAENESRMF